MLFAYVFLRGALEVVDCIEQALVEQGAELFVLGEGGSACTDEAGARVLLECPVIDRAYFFVVFLFVFTFDLGGFALDDGFFVKGGEGVAAGNAAHFHCFF